MSAVDFGRHRLVFRAVGAGIPIAALHGSAASSRQWSSLIEHLGDGFRFIAPDMPGYGGSAALLAGHTEFTGSGCLQATTDRVAALLQTCGRPVHLLGHSAGGLNALKIALSRPDLVASLTLFEPVPFHLLAGAGEAEKRLYREINCVAGTMNADLADDDPAAGMARFVDFWNGRGAWTAMAAPQRLKLAGQCGQVVSDFSAAFAEDWPIADLRRLDMPVQLIMGLRSPAVTLRLTEMLAETIEGTRLKMVPDAGHIAPLSHPDLIAPMIVDHVRHAEFTASLAISHHASAVAA